MYLPKSKYTVKHASWGMFRLEDSPEGEFYVGPYIEDYLGRLYAGKEFSVAQKRPLRRMFEEVKTGRKVEESNTLPTEANYRVGHYIRYFKKNRVSKVCKEVSKDVFEKKEKLWETCSIPWILTGSLDDYYIGSYQKRGVRHTNSVALGYLNTKLPGIVEALELKPEDFVEEIKKNP